MQTQWPAGSSFVTLRRQVQSREQGSAMIVSKPIYTHSPVEAEQGVCSGGHQLAAAAGVAVMQQGGNAIDALTAASFVSFVVEPASCGIGGYGHISVWLAAQNRFVTIDAYGRAPKAATPDMFEVDPASSTYYGHPFTKGRKADFGALSPSVPGAIAGFCLAQELFGKLPLKKVLAPAIDAAEAGVPFTFADKLSIADRMTNGELLPATRDVLLPRGGLPRLARQAGGPDRHDTEQLAKTLKAVAEKGAAAFYSGALAQALGKYMKSVGGILFAEDLAAYRPRVLLEQPASYRGIDYTSCFDQVSYEALNILEHYDLKGYGPDSFEFRHLFAETLGVAFTDSMTHYGDPDFVKAPVDGLASKAFAAARKKLIRLTKALPRPIKAGDPWPYDAKGPAPEVVTDPRSLARREGTSQAAAVDREGNLASCCISIGSAYGSVVFVPAIGCFLNNAMQNYDPRPGLPNSIAPEKMPIFAAPAIVAAKRGKPVFAGSGSGGYRIETAVLSSFLNMVDHGLKAQAAVDQPRVHCQGHETVVDQRIPEAVRSKLAKVGHNVAVDGELPGNWPFGRVCTVAVDRKGRRSGAAGPNWNSSVAGY